MCQMAAVSTERIVAAVSVQKLCPVQFCVQICSCDCVFDRSWELRVFLCKTNWGNLTTKCNGGIFRKFILTGCYLGFI